LKLRDLKQEIIKTLSGTDGVLRPSWEASLILATCLGVGREKLVSMGEEDVSPHGALEMTARRAKGEPLAYVLGTMDFLQWNFLVGPGCLIPRPETEVLASLAAETLGPRGRFLDWGTGSGCIACSLAMMVDGSQGVAMDASPGALKWAWRNVQRYRLSNRVLLVHGSSAHFISQDLTPFDLVVANPPYIPSEHMGELDGSVSRFEPHLALNGGDGGIQVPVEWLRGAVRLLRAGGQVLMETAGDWQLSILEALEIEGLSFVGSHQDQFGVRRVGRWKRVADEIE
jgi:release factor glutamine methyltransferase